MVGLRMESLSYLITENYQSLQINLITWDASMIMTAGRILSPLSDRGKIPKIRSNKKKLPEGPTKVLQ
jgi:hypothetical protein